jgi:hypothetical protein
MISLQPLGVANNVGNRYRSEHYVHDDSQHDSITDRNVGSTRGNTGARDRSQRNGGV